MNSHPPIHHRRSGLICGSLAVFICGALLACVVQNLVLPLQHARGQPSQLSEATIALTTSAPGPAGLDIAEVNLLCARHLPGAEAIDVQDALATLDTWTSRVHSETDRHFYKFHQHPAEYQHSEPYFRILVLITVLQQDFRVHYSATQIQSPDFSDSRNLFLHGLLGPERQGTCVSMPVLYVAVGRRLGYPLKLVTTKAHLFARWESSDTTDHLNIEATNQGLNCFPDDYYRTWPFPITDEEVRTYKYLESLSPAQELAVFLSVRGHCLQAAGRLPEAQLAHAQAHVFTPETPLYLAFLANAVRQERPDWNRIAVDLGQTSALTHATKPPKEL